MRNDYLNSRSKVSVNSGSARTLNGPLLSSSQPKSDSPTDYSQSRLPPKWVDVYEEIKDKIKEVEEKITEIEGLYKRKLKVTFDDDKSLDRDIASASYDSTVLLRECEDRLKEISNMRGTDEDKKIRENIQRSIATQIQGLATTLRKTQKKYMNQISDRDGGMGYVDNDDDDLGDDLRLDMDEIEEVDRQLRNRDKEINKLVDSINELGQIFKELSQLVIDQGTILDRIDYNIEQASHSVADAHVQLVKAEKYQRSARARNCIILLLVLIFVMVIILFVRQTEPQNNR
eukprot:CAMPEP_0115014618 /NCGR_PEP_ID=MMETSP0216-20121206/26205_1 /TAXON_ID=223996 /ORGANISM="Protocruzia adherens, Strain Boccale" /LENGTH=287 /DNA_ID=CAMNT_0002384431 /DNA_START=274 /DNA_END=1137 /DNA_ORIENTATION=+